jgi:hypothetical protein
LSRLLDASIGGRGDFICKRQNSIFRCLAKFGWAPRHPGPRSCDAPLDTLIDVVRGGSIKYEEQSRIVLIWFNGFSTHLLQEPPEPCSAPSALVAVLSPLGFYCLLHGHDDRIRGDRQSLFVECYECGRRSRGIALGPAPPMCPPGPAPLVLIKRRIVSTVRIIAKVTRLLGGLGAPFAPDGHGRG